MNTCYLPTCIQAPSWRVDCPDTGEGWLACQRHMPNCVAQYARNDPERHFSLDFTRLPSHD